MCQVLTKWFGLFRDCYVVIGHLAHRSLVSAKVSSHLEPTGPLRSGGKRPDDISTARNLQVTDVAIHLAMNSFFGGELIQCTSNSSDGDAVTTQGSAS